MPTDTGTVKMQPGADSTHHDQKLRQGVASTLSDAVGTQVTPIQVTPPASQQPEIPQVLPDNPGINFDLEEFIKSETGQSPVKTEPGRGWLGIFKGMLRKKNPGSEIAPEKK